MSDLQTLLAQCRRVYPELKRSVDLEREFVDGWLETWVCDNKPSVLDAGCGFQFGLITYYRDRVRSVGLDHDLSVVRRNKDHDALLASDCGAIPIQSNTFDLIFCRYVQEHLVDPDTVIEEFFRILKPGGALVLTTVNTRNPGMWSVRLVPMWLRSWIRGASFGSELADNAPTFYRANTPRAIRHLLESSGFVMEREAHFPTFMWYSRFSTPLLLSFAAVNHLLARLGLSRFQGGLFYGATKPRL